MFYLQEKFIFNYIWKDGPDDHLKLGPGLSLVPMLCEENDHVACCCVSGCDSFPEYLLCDRNFEPRAICNWHYGNGFYEESIGTWLIGQPFFYEDFPQEWNKYRRPEKNTPSLQILVEQWGVTHPNEDEVFVQCAYMFQKTRSIIRRWKKLAHNSHRRRHGLMKLFFAEVLRVGTEIGDSYTLQELAHKFVKPHDMIKLQPQRKDEMLTI
jgi:hypothetical protein